MENPTVTETVFFLYQVSVSAVTHGEDVTLHFIHFKILRTLRKWDEIINVTLVTPEHGVRMLLGCGSALAEATVGEGFALITSAVVEHLTREWTFGISSGVRLSGQRVESVCHVTQTLKTPQNGKLLRLTCLEKCTWRVCYANAIKLYDSRKSPPAVTTPGFCQHSLAS